MNLPIELRPENASKWQITAQDALLDRYFERGERLLRMGSQARQLNIESKRDGGEDRNSPPTDQ